MLQEYLFKDKKILDEVKNYGPKDVQINIKEIDNSECFVAQYLLTGEKEDSALELSIINEFVIKKFSPIVLTDESSAYFNKRLFPLVNGFERKLRKLLYLKSALLKDSENENIKNLEEKDLGTIFEILFADESFIKEVKKNVTDKTWKFTKNEIIGMIDGLDENTLWDTLLGKEVVPSLRSNFSIVRKYRNSVMHAHNIDVKTYRAAMKLFTEIIVQLDNEIGKLIDRVESNTLDNIELEFNNNLGAAFIEKKEIENMGIYPEKYATYLMGKSWVQEKLASSNETIPFGQYKYWDDLTTSLK